ncbi:MAG: glycosyltransferase family 4 protein [Bacteroidota bacterium]|nr:glycosyltransferase family 4 protein [Bacteroidota bacterium]
MNPEGMHTRNSRPQRILMLLDNTFPPDVRVENEALSLVEAGFEVVLLAIGPDNRPRVEMHRGFTVVRCRIHRKLRDWMRGLSGTIPLLSFFILWQVRRMWRRYPFDAVHAHDLYMCGGALRAARRFGKPVVADLHENWVHVLRHYAWSTRFPGKLFISLRRWRWLERKWVLEAARLLVIVPRTKTRYVQLGVSAHRITVLPNTINVRDFDAYPIDQAVIDELESSFTITYTGTINLHRGLDLLIRALPAVVNACHARLVVVGDGRIRSELEALVRQLGIAAHVWFTGWQDQYLLKSFILGSDVCVAPHVKGPHNDAALPHKLFHYMYLKRPVVVTDCAPMQRIVEQHNCGVVTPYGDVNALSSALLELHGNSELRRQMGANGYRAVVERYNWSCSARELVRMYRELFS